MKQFAAATLPNLFEALLDISLNPSIVPLTGKNNNIV